TCHHKFKISFSGCPIDCFRTTEMDLGFQGQMEPKWNEETCVGCTLCAKACQEGAIVSNKDGKPVYDASKCIYCADCIRVCPTESWMEKRRGWAVRVGGKHGRHPLAAFKVADLVPGEKTFEIIQKTVEWYKENGIGRERIGETIRRLGVEKFKEDVLSNGSKT
ncbi:MAG: 4Fe-4S binding protein, partial [Candidatus Omnitrophica bacterium]|nr:4Fe-4S binding protein [Candidatus Omnitrophota bacterium]